MAEILENVSEETRQRILAYIREREIQTQKEE